MIDLGLNGVILRVKNGTLGDVWDLPLMGKTVEGWVASAIGAPVKTVDASTIINLVDKLRAVVDKNKPVTVVLYGDTPLVSKKTVADAVAKLTAQKLDTVKLPRGCVYRTEYLLGLESVFPEQPSGSGEFDAVRSGDDYSRMTDAVRRMILRYHAQKGVIIPDFDNTYIDCDAVIDRGVTVEPYNFIKGKTVIKQGAHLLPGNYIENCIIGRGARVDSSRLYDSLVGADSTVGPFAYIRPNTVVGCSCRIGDFVELKNCVIGDGSKVSHLTYIGDAELGKECNVGCGVVFANYDGKNKYKSVVGSRVFIGSNSNIVAPVNIADRAFIAAGSTLTADVPAQALAIARARQKNIPDWAGNMYAPLTAGEPTRTYNLVQYADGIIDGSATEDKNG